MIVYYLRIGYKQHSLDTKLFDNKRAFEKYKKKLKETTAIVNEGKFWVVNNEIYKNDKEYLKFKEGKQK